LKKENEILVKFCWEMRRSSDVEGLFITTKEELNRNYGKSVYFGEISGKHSDVQGTLDPCDITIMSEDQEKIEWLQEIFGANISGHNPLAYIQDEYEEEE
jgi:hypothetical protein